MYLFVLFSRLSPKDLMILNGLRRLGLQVQIEMFMNCIALKNDYVLGAGCQGSMISDPFKLALQKKPPKTRTRLISAWAFENGN